MYCKELPKEYHAWLVAKKMGLGVNKFLKKGTKQARSAEGGSEYE